VATRRTLAAAVVAVAVAVALGAAIVLGGDDDPASVDMAGPGTTATTAASAGVPAVEPESAPEASGDVAPSSVRGVVVEATGGAYAVLRPDGAAFTVAFADAVGEVGTLVATPVAELDTSSGTTAEWTTATPEEVAADACASLGCTPRPEPVAGPAGDGPTVVDWASDTARLDLTTATADGWALVLRGPDAAGRRAAARAARWSEDRGWLRVGAGRVGVGLVLRAPVEGGEVLVSLDADCHGERDGARWVDPAVGFAYACRDGTAIGVRPAAPGEPGVDAVDLVTVTST